MILAKLIRGENESVRVATATPATVATLEGDNGPTVATVATVTVATPTKVNFSPSDSRQQRPMTLADEKAIRAWLAHIGEEDPTEIQSVLDECRVDAGSLSYFLSRADEVGR